MILFQNMNTKESSQIIFICLREMAQNNADKNKICIITLVCFLTAGGAKLTITKVILDLLTSPGSVFVFNYCNNSFNSDRFDALEK